jgi:uncharacterized repeat protein (TIGR01451 family)
MASHSQSARRLLRVGAITLAGMCGLAGAGGVLAAAPSNAPITNTASASYSLLGTPVTVTGSVTTARTVRTPATIEFLQYVASAEGLPPGLVASQNMVPVTQCNAGAGFTPLPTPTLPGGRSLVVPASYLLAAASVYASGDVVFVRVTDADQNLDPLVADTVVVTVSSSNGDTESLRLTETGLSTGVFLGYIPTASGPAQSGNCVYNIGGNQHLLATYIDQSEASLAVTAAALVDPLGLVFDATTGLPVNDAQVTLINLATNQPATVFGSDGVSSYPATVPSGGRVSDSGGRVYTFAPGRYQFPRLAPGSYRFAVVPPANYTFPSVVLTPALQALPGGPFVIVTGSLGETFPLVYGPPLEIDLPLDPFVVPVATEVQISKSAGKAAVAVGEFMPYTITIGNSSKYSALRVRIADRLPLGFRYQAGSARLDNAVLPDPRISSDGRGLEFTIGTVLAGANLSLRYVAAVHSAAQVGTAENTAQATGGATSNLARASVLVREDLNRSRAILVGRVTQSDSCEDSDKLIGLNGVRVLLQDGTAIMTDNEGRWHADNLRPGTHVVQLDETSLPKGFELQACQQNSRTGGRNFSQFVNLRGGTLWNADFRFKRVESCLSQQLQVQGKAVTLRLAAPVANQAVSVTVMLPPDAKVVEGSVKLDGQPFSQAEAGDGFLVARLGAQSGNWQRLLNFELSAAPSADMAVTVQVQPNEQPVQRLPRLVLKAAATEAAQCAPIAVPNASAAAGEPKLSDAPVASRAPQTPQLVEKLPYDDKWIAAAAPGVEWLHPPPGFVPALPVVKVVVKHAAKQRVEVKVNGAPVNVLRYEGQVMNPAGTLALSNWRAVELRDGANLMEVTVRDPQGQVVLQESRTIHYAVGPASAVFDAKRSQLVADGRSQPVIAVRMLDKEGQPVRRGAIGSFQIASPFLSQDQAEAIQLEPLTGNLGAKARYQIGDDGVALIALQPTTQAGEVVLNFDFGNNRTQEIRSWLTPNLRDWVLVGFAEGTLGAKTLSGNMESLQGNGTAEQLFEQNRVAFYAKGQIKGDYLLTIAYDSAKEKNAAGSKVLKQAIDPTQYYTLYADATQPQFDAASARKLYLKIEKAQFYAMFGDYDTSLSVTELGRYSRTLNGFKSEYKGERLSYNAFASQTAQSFRKDEIPGDGTSGLYRLAGRDIVVNSDKVRIEARDRFRPEIIVSSKSYTRYLDYQIDPALGTLFFREPIPARDDAFNPVFIVAEYEAQSAADAKLTFGGRVAVRLGEKSEVGISHISEGNIGREAVLTAADTTLRFNDSLKVRGEIASSQRNTAVGKESGYAYLAELSHQDGQLDARAYARAQDAGFGLGQQAGAEGGTRKFGADVRLKLSETLQIQAETYHQENQVNDVRRDVLEARGQWSNAGLTASAGVRAANETDSTGKDTSARQVIGGVGYEMLDKQLTLRASTELDVGSRGDSATFPNRLILGVDYKLNPLTTLFAQHELARGTAPKDGVAIKDDTTRVGLRIQPWSGSEVAASLGNQAGLDSGRLYGNLGLVQKWQINEQWSSDLGVDHSQTLSGAAPKSSGTAQPVASSSATSATTGSVVGDYTALYAGAAYKNKDWSGNARIEWRGSDTDTKINLMMGVQRSLEKGSTIAAGLIYNQVDGAANTSKLDARLSYAHRPLHSDLIWVDRLEYVHESTQDLTSRLLTRKLINNFNANWTPKPGSQISLQYGAKYVLDSIESNAYKGFTDLIGLEARQDISEYLDIGLHASALRSWQTGARNYQLGMSVGLKLAKNSWLSVGYNLRGFVDPDFVDAAYRARGLYLNLRVKFDQDTFNLNDHSQNPLQLKH